MLLEHRPIIRRDQFHRFHAHARRVRRQFRHGHGLEAPVDDGLIDAAVFRAIKFGVLFNSGFPGANSRDAPSASMLPPASFRRFLRLSPGESAS